MFKGPTGRVRLLKTHDDSEPSNLNDLLYCCAIDVEDAMLTGGAIPGEDYKLKDLFQLATPIAIKFINEETVFTAGIPSTHPHAGRKDCG